MSDAKINCLNNMEAIDQIKNELTLFPTYNSQQKKLFFEKYGINVNLTDIQKIENDCGYLVSNLGTNIIEIPPECGQLITNLCKDFENDNVKYNQCVRNLRPKIINVTQTNKSLISNNCVLNNYIELIKNDPSAKNILFAIQQKINDDTKGNSSYCNDLNINVNSQKYLESHNSCINSSIVNQSNYLSACYADKITQENYNDEYKICMIRNGVFNGNNVIDNNDNSNMDNNNNFPINLYVGFGSLSLLISMCFIIFVVIFSFFLLSNN